MKILLDECCCNKEFKDKIFLKSINLIGKSASDEQVLELAKSLNIDKLKTKDVRCAVIAAMGKQGVYLTYRGKTVELKAVEKPQYSDPITYIIHKSKLEILP